MQNVDALSKQKILSEEALSAMIDEEGLSDELLESLILEQELQDTWSSYHLIGDVLNERQVASKGFASNIMNIIEDEATFTLDNKSNVVDFISANAIKNNITSQEKNIMPTWMSNVGQLAIAASVSLAVVFGVKQYSTNLEQSQLATAVQPQILNTIPFTGVAEPVSLKINNMQKKEDKELHLQALRKHANTFFSDYELQMRLNNTNIK